MGGSSSKRRRVGQPAPHRVAASRLPPAAPGAMSAQQLRSVDDLEDALLEVILAHACAIGGAGAPPTPCYRHSAAIPQVCKRWSQVYVQVRHLSRGLGPLEPSPRACVPPLSRACWALACRLPPRRSSPPPPLPPSQPLPTRPAILLVAAPTAEHRVVAGAAPGLGSGAAAGGRRRRGVCCCRRLARLAPAVRAPPHLPRLPCAGRATAAPGGAGRAGRQDGRQGGG